MPKQSTDLGKSCVQLVHVPCRKYLRSEYKNRRVWMGSYLYPTNTQSHAQAFHTPDTPRDHRKSHLIHTFHTTYKEQKYTTLNLILNSTVENAS